MDTKDKKLMLQLLEFLRGTLNADEISPDFFQNVLIKAIDLMPEAQAGSVTLLQDDGFYHFVAANGYDINELSKIKFSADEVLFIVENRDDNSYIIRDLAKLHNADLGKDRAKVMRSVGRTLDIKSTLVLPIKISSKLVATLMLDNFDDVNAFDEDSTHIAEVLALEIAIAIRQIELVNDLRDARLKIKQEIEIIAQEAAIYSRSLINRVDNLELDKFEKKVKLSKRQEQIMGFLTQGKSVAQIADMLDLRRQTVRNYLSGIYKSVGLNTRKTLIAWAKENGY